MILIESNNDEVFNKKATGTSYYNNFLNNEDHNYMKLAKGVEGKIKYLTKDEYFDICSKVIFKVPIKKVYEAVSETLVIKYYNMMKKGIKFHLPYINYSNNSQEGRHRMIAANMLYEKDKFPVLIVTDYDIKNELGLPNNVKLNYGHTLSWIDEKDNYHSKYIGMDENKIKLEVKDMIDKGII